MRTTLDLPDELMREVKIRAAQRDLKLKELFEELIRAGLRATGPVSEEKPVPSSKPALAARPRVVREPRAMSSSPIEDELEGDESVIDSSFPL